MTDHNSVKPEQDDSLAPTDELSNKTQKKQDVKAHKDERPVTSSDALEPLAPEPINPPAKKEVPKSLFFAYLALVLGLFTFGIASVIGVIIATIKKGDHAAGSFEYSHYRYIQRSFWYAVLWSILVIPTLFVGIGFFLVYIPSLWYIYRIIKGCLRVGDGINMYPNEKHG